MPEEPDAGNAMFPTPGHRLEFMTKVRLLGVASVRVDFSGGGDSGDIEGAVFYDRHDNSLGDRVADTVLDWPTETSHFDPRTLEWIKNETTFEPTKLSEIVGQMADKALAECGLDWYNNEGGGGHFIFTFTPEGMDVRLNIGINHTETTEYSFDY